MCLDPRPDSLVRVRRAAARRPLVPVTRVPVTPEADDLDVRGWTLVTRAVALSATTLPHTREPLALQAR